MGDASEDRQIHSMRPMRRKDVSGQIAQRLVIGSVYSLSHSCDAPAPVHNRFALFAKDEARNTPLRKVYILGVKPAHYSRGGNTALIWTLI